MAADIPRLARFSEPGSGGSGVDRHGADGQRSHRVPGRQNLGLLGEDGRDVGGEHVDLDRYLVHPFVKPRLQTVNGQAM